VAHEMLVGRLDVDVFVVVVVGRGVDGLRRGWCVDGLRGWWWDVED